MIEHRPFLALGAIRRGCVDARQHFSVGESGRADHAPLGPLHVWNDVEFAPHSDLGLHAHRDVEIVTWMRSGAITHEDDAGNRARLVANSVHVMSAGAAIHHAERNEENLPARRFPNDEAAIKLLWLALRNVLAKTVRSAFDWKSAMNQFAILFGERFMQARG